MDQESEGRKISLTIYGEPIGQGRGRATYKNGRTWVYDPKKSREYKRWVQICAIQEVKKIYGFKPFNKRVKFRDVRIFHSSHRFFLLHVCDFKYLDEDEGGRELKLGVSYL